MLLRSFRRPVLAFAAVLSLSAAACDSGDTPTDPSDPGDPPATVTETFSGSLTVNGGQSFSFTAQAAGAVTATLTFISPDNTVVGLALGTWNGTICQVILANDNTSRGITVTGQASSGGNLCTRVYDVGQLGSQATFTVTVVHP
jgi:hypothetical protein